MLLLFHHMCQTQNSTLLASTYHLSIWTYLRNLYFYISDDRENCHLCKNWGSYWRKLKSCYKKQETSEIEIHFEPCCFFTWPHPQAGHFGSWKLSHRGWCFWAELGKMWTEKNFYLLVTYVRKHKNIMAFVFLTPLETFFSGLL